MRYTLKQLTYFVAVAEHKNISAAAKSVFISQPSISAAIHQLEDIFGADLIVRHHSKGVSLTSSGHQLLPAARSLLLHAEEFTQMGKQVGSALSGSLTLGCFTTLAPLFVPRIIGTFGEQFSDVNIEIHEGTIDELIEVLKEGKIEVALLYDLNLDDLIETQLLSEVEPYVLVSKSHRLSNRKSVSLSELVEEPMVLLDLPHSREYFGSMFQRLNIEPKIAQRSKSFEMVRGIVSQSNCYSILNIKPSHSYSYDGSEIKCISIKDDLVPLNFVLAYQKGIRLTKRAEVFVEHCKRMFREGDGFSISHE